MKKIPDPGKFSVSPLYKRASVKLMHMGVDGLDFKAAYAQLVFVMAELYKEHIYLAGSDKINTYDKVFFDKIASGNANPEEVKNSLLKLTQLMEIYYNQPVILLADEYDVPLAKASEKGYYTCMLDVIRGILQVIKDNKSLKFAVITGCLRIAKESIFTGTNNFVSDTISDTRLNEYFGFTQDEISKILNDVDMAGHAEEIKEWYDGYHFGKFDVYCPWDVMNYINSLLLDANARPAGYWRNSSSNEIIKSFIVLSRETITQKFEILLSGEYIIQEIKEDLIYECLGSSEENLWSILYFTGYLTKVREENLKEPLKQGYIALVIPNAEVMEIFETMVKLWFGENAQKLDRRALFTAVWEGDAERLTEEMSKMLRQSISYHDYKEDFYHAFFAGIFAGAGYIVESNREHGEGRSDIIVKDYTGDSVVIFEVKYSKTLKSLEDSCKNAIMQIDDRMYAKEFEEEYSKVICYGISFFKKRCLVKKK